LSRLRSSRGSSAGPSTSTSQRTVSAASRRGGVLVQAPKSDIYVVMLGIALGAMVIGSLLMVLILSNYNFSAKVSSLTANPGITRLV
jgi:hypothetical protein